MPHMAIYISGDSTPYPAITPDPSNAGGLCRLRCDSQQDPWACCRTKANVPGCRDADCSGAVYKGSRATAYNPGTTQVTYQNWPYPIIRPGSSCQTWAPCRTSADPVNCCKRKPAGCDAWCTSFGYDNPLATLAPPAPPGSDCRTWAPCRTAANPKECCARKPVGCDAWCSSEGQGLPPLGGDCRTWAPCRHDPSPQACCARKPPGCDPWCATAPPERPTYPPTGDCRDWPPCSGSANPQACCRTKAPGCDPGCRDYAFVGRPTAVVTPTFVGSSFNNSEATDKLYGLDKGYVGDIAL